MCSEKKQALAAELSLKRPAVLAVSGAHNSGKTTLLEKLIPLLRARGLKVGVIKLDGHEFTPDVPGTDLKPLFETILEYIPAPEADVDAPFQMLVSSIDYNEIGRAHV